MNQAARPRDSGLLHLRLPIGAVTSILHRVTGLLLIVMVATVLVFVRQALASPGDYANMTHLLTGGVAHVLGPFAVWIVAHHTYAGVRHLALDAGFVAGRRSARQSAAAVLAAALCTAAIAAVLWP